MRRKRFIQEWVRSQTQRQARYCGDLRFNSRSSPRVRRRRREWHLVEGFGNQLLIVRVGSGDGESNRQSMSLGRQVPLRSLLGSIRGIGARFFPAQRRLRHRAVHRLRRPIETVQIIVRVRKETAESVLW
jgi:hypothetical protein